MAELHHSVAKKGNSAQEEMQIGTQQIETLREGESIGNCVI